MRVSQDRGLGCRAWTFELTVPILKGCKAAKISALAMDEKFQAATDVKL